MSVRAVASPSASRDESIKAPLWLASAVWLIAALFYLTGFYQRVSPAVMTDELMRSFHIGAGALGNLSGFYFYAYVAMQIPTGVLVDSWGARRLLIWGPLIAAGGTFLFGATTNFALACVGRAMIGGATAVAWVVLLKLATHWFPERKFAMLSGLGLFFGNVGALLAQLPLRVAINDFGWRPVVIGSAMTILLVGVLAAAFVSNDPVDKGYTSYAPAVLQRVEKNRLGDILKGLGKIFAYRNTWLIFLSQGAVVGAILTFTGLWGTPFLKARFGLQPTSAASVCSIMIVCWAVASPICGALSDKIGRRKPIHTLGCALATIGWTALFYVKSLSLAEFAIVAAITSAASGAVVVGFAYGKESLPIRYMGTISAIVNIGNMIGPMILQPAVGHVLDKKWTGTMMHGTRVYELSAYQSGFTAIIAWLLLACVLLSLTRETYCKGEA
jgi:MFS family permease